MYLAGVSAMFATSVVALRSLSFRPWLAVIGAVAYVVSPFLLFRSFGHDFLSLYFSVPLGAALALKIGTESSEVRKFFSAGCLVSLAIVATSGLYYAFFTLLFMMFVAVVTSLSQRTYRPLLIALCCVALIFPVLVLTGFWTAIVDVALGKVVFVKRYASEQLAFGLVLAEAAHLFNQFPPLRWAYHTYLAIRPHLSYTTGLEEWPGALLTLAIFASPLLLVAIGASVRERSHLTKLVFMSSACIVFGMLYAIDGGYAYFFNLLISPVIRATARIMPFLSFFALVIVLAGVQMLWEANSPRHRYAAVGILAALLTCMIPSVNGLARKSNGVVTDPNLSRNIASLRGLLAARDQAAITMVLQLPHVYWPEIGPTRAFHAYNHQSPFILDRKGSPTKWSYGGSINQPSYLAVKSIVDAHPATGLPAAASGMGFDSILIEKSAYDNSELNKIRENIEGDPNACKVFDDQFRMLYILKKAACK